MAEAGQKDEARKLIALWPLPWERWVPKLLPKKIIGPYLFYCAFAVRHFKQPWWSVSFVALWGVTVSAMAIFDLRKARMLRQARERKASIFKQARDWPAVKGFVLHTDQSRDADGVPRVTVSYMYRVHDEDFYGSETLTFTSEYDAERVESQCRGQKLRVRCQQDKPEICVLDRDGI